MPRNTSPRSQNPDDSDFPYTQSEDYLPASWGNEEMDLAEARESRWRDGY